MATRIKSLSTNDGHLRNVDIGFADGLNCIIGARGTCKSTIVETIRFAFDHDRDKIDVITAPAGEEGPGQRGLLTATLAGGTARVEIVDDAPGATGITIERDAHSDPSVYQDSVKSIDGAVHLAGIEIYSQGELQELALDSNKRLALVDRPVKHHLRRKVEDAADAARASAAIGPKIREYKSSLRSIRSQLKGSAELRRALDEAMAATPEVPQELETERVAHDRRKAQINNMERRVADYSRALDEAATAMRAVIEIADATPAAADLELESLQQIQAVLIGAGEQARAFVKNVLPAEGLEEALNVARLDLDKMSANYFALMQKEQTVSEGVRQQARLRAELEKLERVEAEVTKMEVGLAGLEHDREQHRNRSTNVRNEIYELRLSEVDRINATTDNIVLRFRHGTNTAAYLERLTDLLQGSRLRDQEGICQDIASALSPAQLTQYVEREESKELAQLLNRDESQVLRLLSHLADHEELYSLEETVCEDELDITMFIEGAPRSVSEMSKGQMATAILPLILRPAPYPLILDQPEDDLDNAFIVQGLVERVRSLKLERQIIFVTHNANIPVIGDAEAVFVMRMEGGNTAAMSGPGDVQAMKEQILLLLEGGEAAFEKRAETYGNN